MNLRHGVPAALHLRGLPMLKTVEIEAEAMMVSSIFPLLEIRDRLNSKTAAVSC